MTLNTETLSVAALYALALGLLGFVLFWRRYVARPLRRLSEQPRTPVSVALATSEDVAEANARGVRLRSVHGWAVFSDGLRVTRSAWIAGERRLAPVVAIGLGDGSDFVEAELTVRKRDQRRLGRFR